MTIEIKTLTPIWTGDVNGKCTQIRETGITGSMRWWYEAIIRGLGGYVCDPASPDGNTKKTKTCKFNDNKFRRSLDSGKYIEDALDEQMCQVCQLFGCTGWKKRFNLSIRKDKTEPAWDGDITLNVRPPQRKHGWYLPSGRTGSFTIKIQGDPSVIGSLASLFLFLESYGALGAKSQLGYGFFKIINRPEVQEYAIPWSLTDNKDQSGLPDLSHWLFFEYRFQPTRDDWWSRIEGLQRLMGDRQTANILSQLAEQGMIPVSPVLKNQWRFEKWDVQFPAKRWLMGISKGDNRIRSKIATSWAYRDGNVWVVRGWGWLPEQEERGTNFVQNYHQEIDLFEKILKDGAIWKKALNLNSVSVLEPQVVRLTKKEEVIKFLER